MKLSKYNLQYQNALKMIEEAESIIKYVDGTKKENYKVIDLACTMISEFEKIKNSYVKIALAENDLTIKIDKKELSKWDKFYDTFEKYDFVGKGLAIIKSRG